MKQITLILFLAIVAYGCSEDYDGDHDSQNNELNLKDFFCDINSLEEPIVMVYTVDSVGHLSQNYYQYSRISEDRIEVIIYNSGFEPQATIIDEFNENGVELISNTPFIENDSNSRTSKILKGQVFSFIPGEVTGDLETQINGIDNGIEWSTIDKVSWGIIDTVFKEFNNNKTKTLITKGIVNREILFDGQPYRENLPNTNWYSEGIGLTRLEYESPFGTVSETYVKTITIEEFNELKKGANKS